VTKGPPGNPSLVTEVVLNSGHTTVVAGEEVVVEDMSIPLIVGTQQREMSTPLQTSLFDELDILTSQWVRLEKMQHKASLPHGSSGMLAPKVLQKLRTCHKSSQHMRPSRYNVRRQV
jgi:hypothetical protein